MQPTDYIDFELHVGYSNEYKDLVAVVQSPEGDTLAVTTFRFSQAFENCLQDLRNALLHSDGRGQKRSSKSVLVAREFGLGLFDTVMAGEVRSVFDAYWRQAADQQKIMRLKLHVYPPQLAALPWEFLYNPDSGEFVCLFSTTPLVRCLNRLQPSPDAVVKPPLRILGVVANPPGFAPEDAEREEQRLEEAIRHLRASGLVELDWVRGQTWRDVQYALGKGSWHVLHYIGDGGFDPEAKEGFLVLADESGGSHHLSAGRLGRLLASRGSPPLVLLSLCEGAQHDNGDRFSSTAKALVERDIAAVLAMPYPMTQSASAAFASGMYEALSRTEPLDLAVAQARLAIHAGMADTIEWGIPVLYTHSPDLRLFDRAALGETALRQGDEALTHDNLERAIALYVLAGEMGAGPAAMEGKELSERVKQTLKEAEDTLTSPSSNPETQADALLKVMGELEELEQRLPESRTIQIELRRARGATPALRDRLWDDGQRLAAARTVGLTLGRRYKRMQKSVHLLERACQLDQEDLPDLKEDLSKARHRLSYLENARSRSEETRGRRFLLYGVLGAAAVGVLLLALFVFGLVPVSIPAPIVAQTSTSTPGLGATPQATSPVASHTPTLVTALTASGTVGPASTATATLASSPTAEADRATATPARIASSTPSPSALATHTSTPRSSTLPTRTPTPTLSPTDTPTAESPTAPPTRTHTPSPTATPTPGLIYPAPKLIQPEDVVFLSDPVDVAHLMYWTWAGDLQEDEWFDIRIWTEGMPHRGIAWTKQPEYRYDICLLGSGHYYWSVAVVRGRDGKWLGNLSPEAPPRRFSTSRSDEWCDRHNRFSLDEIR